MVKIGNCKNHDKIPYNTEDVELIPVGKGTATITITFNGKDLALQKYSRQTKDFKVTVGEDAKVSYALTNVISDNTSDEDCAVSYGSDFTCTLSVGTGYSLPEAITVVTASRETLTTSVAYNNRSGAVTVSHVTEDITITAAAGPAYTETSTLYNHLKLSGKTSDIKARSTYIATLAMNDDVAAVCYQFPDTITVAMGGTALTAGTDYTYDAGSGAITVPNVSGNIAITATGAINTSYGFKDTLNITADPNYSDDIKSANGQPATATKGSFQTWRFDDGNGRYTVESDDSHGITKIPNVIKAYEEGTDCGGSVGGNWDSTVTVDAGLSVAVSSYVLVYKYFLDNYDFVLVNVKAPEYTVTFKDFDGKTLGTPQTIVYGNSATAPADPSRTGYTFTGWSPDFSYVTGDMTVTAQYTINPYTLTFMNGGDAPYATITQYYDTSVTAPADPERPGHTFNGWVDDHGNKLTVPSTMPAESRTFYASWTPNTYTVTFHANNGTEDTVTQGFTYGESKNLTVNTFANSGYSFLGWSGDWDAHSSVWSDGVSYTYSQDKDVDLYAVWGAKSDTTYKVYRYYQNLDGVTYTKQEGTGSGTTGDKTNTALDVPGFAPKTYEEQIIKGDLTTAVEIRYDRKSYNLTVTYADTTDTMTAAQIPADKTISLLYGTPYSVTSTGVVTYHKYSDATNYTTVTLATQQLVHGYISSAKSATDATMSAAQTVAVSYSNMKTVLKYFVALEAGKTYDADDDGNVKPRSTDLYTESLGKIDINPFDLIAFITEHNLTGQTSANGRYCLIGNQQIADFFAYCIEKKVSSTSLMTSGEAIAAINASTGPNSTKMRKTLLGGSDGTVSDAAYRVTWTVLKYEGDGWHIDGRIDPINYHTVTYFVGGSKYASYSYKDGTAVAAIENPTQSGYDFSGWKLSDGTGFAGVTSIAGDWSVYGTFTLINNGGNGGGDNGGGNGDGNGDGGDREDDTPVVIPNNPTPLNPTPLNPTPGATTEIPDGDVPQTEIPDGETPLAATPAKTGDNLILWVLAAGVSGIGLVWVSLMGRKRRDEDGSQN